MLGSKVKLVSCVSPDLDGKRAPMGNKGSRSRRKGKERENSDDSVRNP